MRGQAVLQTMFDDQRAYGVGDEPPRLNQQSPYIRVRGQWRFLYRAVDIAGHTIDFLLTEQRGAWAAIRFLTKALTTDNAEHDTTTEVRQVRYHNNIVEQDHRAVQRVVRPILGCMSREAAQRTMAGIEVMPMIKKE
jgi:transposase-like protein